MRTKNTIFLGTVASRNLKFYVSKFSTAVLNCFPFEGDRCLQHKSLIYKVLHEDFYSFMFS